MSASAKFLEVPEQESVGVKIIRDRSGQFEIPAPISSNYQNIPGSVNTPPYFLISIDLYQIFYVPDVPDTDPPRNNDHFHLIFPRPTSTSFRVAVYNNAPTYAGYMITYSGKSGTSFVRNQTVPHDHPDENLIFPSSVKFFIGSNNGSWSVF